MFISQEYVNTPHMDVKNEQNSVKDKLLSLPLRAKRLMRVYEALPFKGELSLSQSDTGREVETGGLIKTTTSSVCD